MMNQGMMGQPGMMNQQQGQSACQTWQDMQDVQLQGQVVAASYAPQGQWNDVTMSVKNLQQQGRNFIQGGIHTAIGDPAPGVPKVFRVWFWERPSQTWQDMQDVSFTGQVACASYGPQNQFNDVTQAVRNLQQQGRNYVQGGIHTAIGDPAPGVPKQFKVWY